MVVGVVKSTRKRFVRQMWVSGLCCALGIRSTLFFPNDGPAKTAIFFKSAGLLLEEKQILVVKSNQAHRASFDPVVSGTIELNTPGVSTVNYASLPYRYLRRPIWPIDETMHWALSV